MNAHFATRLLDDHGEWLDAARMYNSSADVSPTASQMPRFVGLALASKLYRQLGDAVDSRKFSTNGDEIAFGTIGNASSAEGLFWESINAISVLQAPAVVSIWDDAYGISVHNQQQFGKDLGDLLLGFRKQPGDDYGYNLFSAKGWDYPSLVDVYKQAAKITRLTHTPSLIHVTELTQPQGHSTSGSHERYKPAERLDWEAKHDGLFVFRKWLIDGGFVSEAELLAFEEEDVAAMEAFRAEAWQDLKAPVLEEISQLNQILENVSEENLPDGSSEILNMGSDQNETRRDVLELVDELLRNTCQQSSEAAQGALEAFRESLHIQGKELYSSHLYSESGKSALKVQEVPPVYSDRISTSKWV